MKTIKRCIQIIILVSLAPLTASAGVLLTSIISYFDKNAPPSFADHLRLKHSKNPSDHRWLPELTGLPDRYQIALLTQRMMNIMMQETDSRCASISSNLRMMIFQHFLIYQHLVNSQHIYFDERVAHKWAHVLAMTLKESSGDSSSITDMCGYSITTDQSKTNLQQWRQILNLSSQSHVELNIQTNFGLTQTSYDRLIDAFRLSKDQRYDTAFLEGTEGLSTPGKIKLNTAIAIRRLIWFYQGFAQGRILESEEPLRQQEVNNPQFSAQYKAGIDMALLYCGTHFMFPKYSQEKGGKGASKLENAMASIAFCKLGNQENGYDANAVDEQCFAEWVTLCPALNIDIATLTPLSYFATRGQEPVCEDTFKRLIINKPVELKLPLPQF